MLQTYCWSLHLCFDFKCFNPLSRPIASPSVTVSVYPVAVIDKDHRSLSELLDRDIKSNSDWSNSIKSGSSLGRTSTSPTPIPSTHVSSPTPSTSPKPLNTRTSTSPIPTNTKPATMNLKVADEIPILTIADVFNDYASATTSGAGSGGIDGAKFLKFCKDSKLISPSSKFRKEDVDIVFAKYKESGQRHLSKSRFNDALQDIAQRKKMSFDELVDFITSNTPSAQGCTSVTTAMPNRLHDDTSSYTGVYKAGGPTMVDKNHRDLSHLVRPGMK